MLTNIILYKESALARHAVKLWIALICFLMPASPVAGAVTPDEVILRVQAQYDKSQAFKAWFTQESRLSVAGQTDRAEGWMYFQKPCRMRWDYKNPPEQQKEVVADGRQVWMYIPQDNIVMVYPLNQVMRSDLVMRFFSGIGQFREDFHISWHRPPEESLNYQVDLYPKKAQAELKRLTLSINPDTLLVENLEFANALGEETRFTFSRMDMNIRLPADFFTFTPPPGVQVVREGSR